MSEESKWVTFRDSVLEAIKFDNVTEVMKNDFCRWFLEVAIPIMKVSGKDFVKQTKEQGASEKGWNKVRDLVLIPFLVEGGLWLIEYALVKVVKEVS